MSRPIEAYYFAGAGEGAGADGATTLAERLRVEGQAGRQGGGGGRGGGRGQAAAEELLGLGDPPQLPIFRAHPGHVVGQVPAIVVADLGHRIRVQA